MSSTKTNPPVEREVVRIWQQILQRRRLLDDSEGRPIEIVYPGRLNDGQGGDFRDAVVTSGDICKTGDIEIHTRSSLWEGHAHHRNPVYNRVVLHVAFEQDKPGMAFLQTGQAIPTVILKRHTDAYLQGAVLLYPRVATPSVIKKYLMQLEYAGKQCFIEKAGRYQAELDQGESGQSLYQGILEALGYAKNKQPFLELAGRLPLHIMEELANRNGTEEDIQAYIQAVLCEGASALDWELYKVRPENSPLRRIAALSHLLYRHRKRGWLLTLMNIIQRVPVRRVSQELELALRVDEGRPALLGRGRAAEIIVNVILPFAWSWARKKAASALTEKVMKVYSRYPRLGSNSIERHMLRQFSLRCLPVNSACLQQGLIHVYKTFCILGKCEECFFSGLKPCRVSSA